MESLRGLTNNYREPNNYRGARFGGSTAPVVRADSTLTTTPSYVEHVLAGLRLAIDGWYSLSHAPGWGSRTCQPPEPAAGMTMGGRDTKLGSDAEA